MDAGQRLTRRKEARRITPLALRRSPRMPATHVYCRPAAERGATPRRTRDRSNACTIPAFDHERRAFFHARMPCVSSEPTLAAQDRDAGRAGAM